MSYVDQINLFAVLGSDVLRSEYCGECVDANSGVIAGNSTATLCNFLSFFGG